MPRYVWQAYDTTMPNPQDEYALNQSDGRWITVPDTPVIDQSQLNYNNGANTLADTGPIQRVTPVIRKVPKVGTPAFARKTVLNSGNSFKRGAKSPSGVVLSDTPNYTVLEPANATSYSPIDPGGYYDENGNWVNTSEVYSDSLIRPQETPKTIPQPNPLYNEFHNDGWEGFPQQSSTVFKKIPSYNLDTKDHNTTIVASGNEKFTPTKNVQLTSSQQAYLNTLAKINQRLAEAGQPTRDLQALIDDPKSELYRSDIANPESTFIPPMGAGNFAKGVRNKMLFDPAWDIRTWPQKIKSWWTGKPLAKTPSYAEEGRVSLFGEQVPSAYSSIGDSYAVVRTSKGFTLPNPQSLSLSNINEASSLRRYLIDGMNSGKISGTELRAWADQLSPAVRRYLPWL